MRKVSASFNQSPVLRMYFLDATIVAQLFYEKPKQHRLEQGVGNKNKFSAFSNSKVAAASESSLDLLRIESSYEADPDQQQYTYHYRQNDTHSNHLSIANGADGVSAKIADITRALAMLGVTLRTNVALRARSNSSRGTLVVLESIEGLIQQLYKDNNTALDVSEDEWVDTSSPTIHQQPSLSSAMKVIVRPTLKICVCSSASFCRLFMRQSFVFWLF